VKSVAKKLHKKNRNEINHSCFEYPKDSGNLTSKPIKNINNLSLF